MKTPVTYCLDDYSDDELVEEYLDMKENPELAGAACGCPSNCTVSCVAQQALGELMEEDESFFVEVWPWR